MVEHSGILQKWPDGVMSSVVRPIIDNLGNAETVDVLVDAIRKRHDHSDGIPAFLVGPAVRCPDVLYPDAGRLFDRQFHVERLGHGDELFRLFRIDGRNQPLARIVVALGKQGGRRKEFPFFQVLETLRQGSRCATFFRRPTIVLPYSKASPGNHDAFSSKKPETSFVSKYIEKRKCISPGNL